MTAIRSAASLLSLLNGYLLVFVAWTDLNLPTCTDPASCPSSVNEASGILSLNLDPHGVLFAVGVVFIINSIFSFGQRNTPFILGIVLSAAAVVIVALQFGTYASDASALAVVLSAVVIVLDAAAWRDVSRFPEETTLLDIADQVEERAGR